ncbi:panthothenate synthetase [Gallaecimonas kandeliae]|uniref:panthothenate synthetase n=1 Tax=Gallaecimonas kandeliae TaxID=3029055 RepID=UPI0026498BBB|nr:panthothenate synthetase [Gallaecimonas kandeliae]WKE64792.1 panthothenate synthetase [Gallaecimonas kandeliae]
MKMLVQVQMPVEPFNQLVRDGSAGSTLAAMLESIRPESAYFFAPEGCRGCILVVDIQDPAQIPSIAEPFFLKLGAQCFFHPVMSPDDLARAGLEDLGRKWR